MRKTMPRLRYRMLIGAAMTATLTAGTVAFVGVQGASAVPYDCNVGGTESYSGWALCTGGTGSYQAVVSCDVSWGPDYRRGGAWEKVGTYQRSVATCKTIRDRAYNRTLNAIGPL